MVNLDMMRFRIGTILLCQLAISRYHTDMSGKNSPVSADLVPELVEWAWLKDHLKRDALIVVSHSLTLIDAARAIAADQSATVSHWINTNRISKPTAEQILAWDQNPEKRFFSLIVQPYVLIQEFSN